MAAPTDVAGHGTLRARLVRATLVPALVLVAAGAVFDYATAVDTAGRMQDSLLRRTAAAIALRLTPDEAGERQEDILRELQPEDIALPRSTQGDVTRFVAFNGSGGYLTGDATLARFAQGFGTLAADTPAYGDAELDGAPVRLVRYWHAGMGAVTRVVVAETTRSREANMHRLLWSALWPNLLIVVMTFVLLRRGIARAVAPLARLGTSIDRRGADDFRPIQGQGVPGEVQPLVEAMNRLLARMEKAAADQQVFLSAAAHQLRTPLAGLMTQVELAQAAPADAGARLARMQASLQDLAHCTQQLLALTRSSAHAVDAHDFTTVDLRALVEDAASDWLDTALRRGVELDFELAPAACTGSRWMLQEMLANLVDNATKYAPAGSGVRIRCGAGSDGAAWVEVEDAGPGVPDPLRERLFEPFVRGSADVPGAGLGLAIAREVALRHGSRIGLHDVQPHGTRVRVDFPAPGRDALDLPTMGSPRLDP